MVDSIYTPLVDGKFRTLTLQPGQHDDEIQCELFQHSFAENPAPEYEALSYVWGAAENPGRIKVRAGSTATHGLIEDARSWRQLTITRNLEVALRHLRRPDESRVLWVDAVCINQKDKEEKPFQIAKMDKIYRNAKHVLAWLGEDDDNSQIAMRFMKQLENRGFIRVIGEYLWDFLYTGWAVICGKYHRWVPWRTRLRDKEKEAVFALWKRPYWSRVWMILELASPEKDPLVGCGDTWISLNAFRHAEKVFARGFSALEDDFCFWKQLRIRDEYRTSNKLDLFDLLHRTRNFGCSEERDRILAIRSLLSEEDQEAIQCTETDNYQSIIKNTTRFLLQKDLRILSRCFFTILPHEIRTKQTEQNELLITEILLPSWVPKLYQHVGAASAWSFHPTDGPYNASGGHGSSRNCDALRPTFTDDGETLIINGLAVDKVLESIGPFRLEDILNEPYTGIKKIANFAFRAHRLGRYGAVSWQWSRQQRNGISLEDFCNCLLSGAAKEPIPCANDATPFDDRAVDRAMLQQFFPLDQIILFDRVVATIRGLLGIHPRPIGMRLEEDVKAGDVKTGFVTTAFEAIQHTLLNLLLGRMLFLTESGYLGIGPPCMPPGSCVAILCGGPVCYILSPLCPNKNSFLLVGDAYVHGLMKGEEAPPFDKGGVSKAWETILIE